MVRIKQAMENQMVRMINEDEQHFAPSPPDTEIVSLLQAFASLIDAYIKRVGELPPARGGLRPSDTFGTNA